MTEKAKRDCALAGLFAAYVFLMLTMLRIANHAGDGFLPTAAQEKVYYALQVFVLLGYFAHALVRSRVRGRAQTALLVAALALYFAAFAVLLFGKSTPFYLACTFAASLSLGYLSGSVHEQMSHAAALGSPVALCGGTGYALGVAGQYLLQLRRESPLLIPVSALAFAVFAALLLRAPAPDWPAKGASGEAPTPRRRLILAAAISAILLLFSSFYNSYIHHLQISSGYVEYNVYTWPRLMMLPCSLLFALIGDQRGGRFVPLTALCIALAALLNSVLTGSAGAYWLNMCLFYFSLAAAVSYYHLAFWRLAPGTKHPALWAGMGRMLDSAMVLLSALLHLSALPPAAVLTIDVAGLAVLIVLMALGGDFVFAAPAGPAAPAPDAETRLRRFAETYGLTPRETALLRELVLTEDKQDVIAQRLAIQKSTVQFHTTSLYRKTGASTRSGLSELFYNLKDE